MSWHFLWVRLQVPSWPITDIWGETYVNIRNNNWYCIVHPNIFVMWHCHKSFITLLRSITMLCGDWHYFIKYSPYQDRMWGISCGILSVPQNIVMDINNVMLNFGWKNNVVGVSICIIAYLGEITPSYILHTRAFETYLLGGLFILQKIL